MTVFNVFKDGDLVTSSGVYSALHSTPHKLVERATYVEGDRFESCRCALSESSTGLTNPSFRMLRSPQPFPRLRRKWSLLKRCLQSSTAPQEAWNSFT